ncbi:hypothetical protein HYY71_00675 [Candidatus Woesearchaeota archaeon]|nr:hypothetical protein [Candidatus Woesearchaeota archaeon]
MVKMKIKLLLICIIAFVFLTGTAHAAPPRLEFSDVDVTVGGKFDKNLRSGDRIDREAKPGDLVEFRVEVRNNFSRAEGIEIQDITVEVTIEDIDDNSDLEEESREFDLNAERDRRQALEFRVPGEVEEREYTVIINAQGEDVNGTSHEIEMRLILEVEKENHLLDIVRSSLSPSIVSCNRKDIKLDVTVLNVGNEDEQDIIVEMASSPLGLSLKDKIEELLAEPNEEESRFSKIYAFNIDNSVQPGNYPILLRVLYDNDRLKVERTLTLTVNECQRAGVGAAPTAAEKKPEIPREVELILPKADAAQIPSDATATTEGFFDKNTFVLAVIIGTAVSSVFIGALWLIGLFVRVLRKKA